MTEQITACPFCEHMPDNAVVKLCEKHACKACEARAAAGLEGQCPACAQERTRLAMAAEREREQKRTKITPGPWELRGVQVRADGGRGAHVGTYQIGQTDGRLMAASPELLELLLSACSSLDACENGSRSHCTADRIRERLAALKLIGLGRDEHGHLSEREDPEWTVMP